RELKAYYVDLACRRTRDALIDEFFRSPFEPYAPIRRQMFNILREVNRRRKKAGYELVPKSAIWLKRRVVKPFEQPMPVGGEGETTAQNRDTRNEAETRAGGEHAGSGKIPVRKTAAYNR